MRVRDSIEKDSRAVKRLLAESLAAQQPPGSLEKPDEIPKRLERTKLPRSFEGKIRYLIAEDAGEVAGLCVFYTYSDGHEIFADIRDLYIKADRRGQGLGTALLEKARMEAAKEGCWSLIALPPEGSSDIVRVLEKPGFQRGQHQPFMAVLRDH